MNSYLALPFAKRGCAGFLEFAHARLVNALTLSGVIISGSLD